jgi:hypothetical protein
MDLRAAVELKTLLVGVPLPAEKPGLLEYAVRQRAEPRSLDAIQSLPDRRYNSLDEVLEGLVHVQPKRLVGEASDPRAESGGPPGGPAYTRSRRPARDHPRGTK